MPGEDYQSWSTTAANNGAIDSAINWAEGQPRASVNNSSRSQMAAHAKNRNLLNGSIVTGGTTNAQTFTSGVGYTTVPTGLQVRLKIGPNLSSVAGTATTLNMDGIGAVNIKTQKGDNVTSGLLAGTYVNFLYDGTNWIWLDSGVGNTTTIITNVIVSSTTTGPIALVDFTDLDSNKFARYSVVVTNFMPEIDGAILMMSVSTDNGVTFPIDINDYTIVETYMSGGRIAGGLNFVTAVEYSREYQGLCWGVGSTTPQYPASILIDLFNFRAGVSPTYYWNSGSYEPVFEGAQLDNGWGNVITRTGCNAIRLWPNAGNIVSGTFTLYGSN
jgi:hypothetical protein